MQLGRHAEQITADIPGWIARVRGYFLTEVLTAADELAAAERACAAGLARSREAGDLWNQGGLVPKMAAIPALTGRFACPSMRGAGAGLPLLDRERRRRNHPSHRHGHCRHAPRGHAKQDHRAPRGSAQPVSQPSPRFLQG